MTNQRLPLLLTASVSTKGMKGACFSDEEREEMYAGALTFYINTLLRHPGQKIVLAENSGWDIQSLRSKLPPPTYLPDQLEFISLDPNQFDISKGKGYNELLMINLAIEQSQAIKNAGGFFKATGRYPIYNIEFFIKRASDWILGNGGNLYADVKDHKLYEWLRTGWCGHSFECRLFGVALDYYREKMAPVYASCNDYDGRLLEHQLFAMLKELPHEGLKLRFPREPHFGGLEGSNIRAASFTKEQDSLKGKLKRTVGNGIRLFLPWFWF